MFTGIVQAVGRARSLTETGSLDIAADLPGEPLSPGESVAVNGVCLTIVSCRRGRFRVDVSPETFSRTNLGRVRPGERLNLERALTLASRLGGHLVAGHVDAECRLVERRREGTGERHVFELPADLARYVAFKGSVTLDGVSLTVARREGVRFEVALIPYTLAATNLGDRRPGDALNLEVDLVARYVETLLAGRKTVRAAAAAPVSRAIGGPPR
jgi:riboflavin synthase